MKFQNPKTGELYEMDQPDDNSRDEAIKQGYIPIVSVRNPKTKEVYHIDDRNIGDAIKQGYEYDTGAISPSKSKERGTVDAVVRSVANGATLGHADELVGVVGGGIDAITSDKSLIDAYRDNRDFARKGDADAQDQHPGISLAGNIAGSVLTGGAVTGGLAKAGAAGMKGVLAGGAIDALGQSDADLTKGEIGKASMDVAGGTLLAGGIGLVGKGLGKTVDTLADQNALRASASQHAVDALKPILSQQEILNNKGLAKELGGELLDEDIIKFGRSVKNMQPDLERVLKDKGQAIGALRKEAQDAGNMIDLSDLKPKGEDLVTKATNGIGSDVAQANAYRNNVQRLGKIPERSVEDTQDIIHRINETLNFNKALNKITPAEQASMELRKDLVGKVDEAVGKLGEDKAAMYDKLKKQFRLFKEGDQILDKSVARQERNRAFSLTDYIAGGSAMASGSGMEGLKGMAMAGANKVLRERGSASAAAILNGLAKDKFYLNSMGKFGKVIADAARKGNSSLLATHTILMRDPEYKALIEQNDDNK